MHATIFTLALSKQPAWLRSGEQCVAGTPETWSSGDAIPRAVAMAGALRAEIGWRGPLERIADAVGALGTRSFQGKAILDLNPAA
jgi:hypothetical protein